MFVETRALLVNARQQPCEEDKNEEPIILVVICGSMKFEIKPCEMFLKDVKQEK